MPAGASGALARRRWMPGTLCGAPMSRQRLAAPAVALLALHPVGWTATLVNAEQVRTGPNGTVRLCQAVPPTLLSLRVRYDGAVAGERVRLRVTAPGHRTRVRHLRLPARAGRATRTFSPRGLGLRADAFEAGRYTVRAPGLRASVRLAGEALC